MIDPALAKPPARSRRVAFLGTPAAAVPTLAALVEAGFEVPLVVTQPDRRRGRGSKSAPSPVKAAAVDLGLPVGHDPYDLLGVDLDVAVVVAYGRLLRRDLLVKVPMLNVHFSLLPRWRGAAPVERAILAGDPTTGVCVMGITEGLDEGPLYRCVETEIADDESALQLTARLAALGARLTVQVLSDDLPEPTPQSGEIRHAAKIDRADNVLDFSLPAVQLHRRIRIGRAWTLFRSDRLVVEEATIVDSPGISDGSGPADHLPGRVSLITDPLGEKSVVVAAGEGTSLRLDIVKPAGKRSMASVDWWNGAQPERDEHLGR